MREVWSKSSISDRAINRVTVDTSRSFENEAPGGGGRIVLGELLLFLHPSLKVLRRVHIHTQQHLRVLGAAVLGALAQEKPSPFRLNPHRVYFVGDEVRLARQTRHPETVHNVGRTQIQKRRESDATVTDGHVQFVGCYDAELGITNLPPPL